MNTYKTPCVMTSRKQIKIKKKKKRKKKKKKKPPLVKQNTVLSLTNFPSSFIPLNHIKSSHNFKIDFSVSICVPDTASETAAKQTVKESIVNIFYVECKSIK